MNSIRGRVRRTFVISAEEVNRLEKRASNAVNGYTSDVNITCYVYGQDVIKLLNERQLLMEEIERLKTSVMVGKEAS